MFIAKVIVTRSQLEDMASQMFGELVKGVVDIERELLALDAGLHSDLESYLIRDGSQQKKLWGINLYPEIDDEDFIEFDSMINIRPLEGNRSRSVEDEVVQEQIREIVSKWVQ